MEVTLNQALKRAQEFKSDGKFQEADKIYTLIIKKFPGQATASVQLADIALKYNKPNIAYRLILDAIRANAESELLWIFLSQLLKEYSTDLVPKSECYCRQTSEFKILPADEKLVSLVKKELRKSNTDVIIDKCERLLKRNTVTEYTVVTLASCYQLKGMMTKEQELLTKYCEILKTSSRLRFMLSNNLLLQKKYSQALCEAAWLIGQYPKYAHVLQVIGIALQEIAKISASIEFLKLALELDGADSNSLTAMGDAYRLSTRYDQAKEFYLKAVDAKPDNVTAEINLGLAYRKLGQYKEALDIYFKLADAKNVDVNIYNNIGALYFDQGDLTQAQKYLKEAIIRFPNDGSAHRHLTLSRKYTGNEKQIDTLLALVEDDQVKEDSKLQARFALGKIFDDLGDYENAFQNFLIGNTIKKKLSKYSIEKDRQLFDRIRAAYVAEIKIELSDYEAAKQPIFVVGMPRSGTTLIEQILSSHSQVYGAGELDSFSLAVLHSNVLSKPTEMTFDKMASFYLQELSNLSANENFIIDKMPLNFRWIGFILKSIPNAKVVLVERDPIAVAWSIFRQFFATPGNGYSNDLDDIAEYLKLYRQLSSFWEAEFGDRIYKLRYENLTENQEQETCSLLDYVGLDFEKQCLAFQNNKRAVQTASNAQVRRGLYKGSSKVWKNYEPYLSCWIEKHVEIFS